VLELSEVIELTEESEERTSETGATPSEDSISSRSLEEGGIGDGMAMMSQLLVRRRRQNPLALILVDASTAANASGRLLHVLDLLLATPAILLLAQGGQLGLLAFQLSLAIHVSSGLPSGIRSLSGCSVWGDLDL